MTRSRIPVTLSALVAAGALLALMAGQTLEAQAIPVPPTNAPLTRVIQNITEYITAHPDDPEGYYTLGRAHYFAFAAPRTGKTVPVLAPQMAPGMLPRLGNALTSPGRITPVSGEDAVKLPASERGAHIREAVGNLRKAILLRDRQSSGTPEGEPSGLFELTLASVYEDSKADAVRDWRERAITNYRRAWVRSSPADLGRTEQPMFGAGTLVSHEAGRGYLRLVRERGVRPWERATVAEVQKGVTQLAQLPPSRMVTPIVFALNPAAGGLTGLIAPRPEGVRFDLDGSGRAVQRYSAWPRPETAILVWDPTGTGQVTSGRQMFGGATWWLFWEDGYRALDSLDDDRDGWLVGAELAGLALWRDRNGNGLSDPGEVIPIDQTPVAGIATQPDGTDGASPMHPAGLRLKDGSTLPTYDWTVRPMATNPRGRFAKP